MTGHRTLFEEWMFPNWRTSARQNELFDLLDQAIPEGECELLRVTLGMVNHAQIHPPTGGMVYKRHPIVGDVATYNNTRADEQEILAWLQRALELTL